MKNDKMLSHHGENSGNQHKNYPNETIKLLFTRASCRNFSKKKISHDILQYILEAGIHSPTGGNLQPYSIIKVENSETKQKLTELCGKQNFISAAPVNLLFCIDWHRIERWAKLEAAPFTATSSFRHFWISFQDTIICAQNICTVADSLGLGSVYVGTVLESFLEIKELFQLPKGVFPVVLLSLGYPETRALSRRKLGVDVIVHNERYHEITDQKLVDAFNEKYYGLKMKITEERLNAIASVAREVHGEGFAKKCVEKIKKNRYINWAQQYFGIHYPANYMPKDNDTYMKLMEEFGFNWFKKYYPLEDKEK